MLTFDDCGLDGHEKTPKESGGRSKLRLAHGARGSVDQEPSSKRAGQGLPCGTRLPNSGRASLGGDRIFVIAKVRHANADRITRR
jgi:hypothetical protein